MNTTKTHHHQVSEKKQTWSFFLNLAFTQANSIGGIIFENNKMKKIIIFLFASTFVLNVSAQKKSIFDNMDFSGYSQLRFTSDFSDENSFSMRRLKLWINSTPNFDEHWGYKVQTTISSFKDEDFFLQDVLVNYRQKQFKFNIGQFVPHYSLQRFQHDYTIPLMERSSAINALIPNGTLGVRDIGVEAKYMNVNKTFETWLGMFNGYGIKEYRSNNTGIMLTHKTALHLFSKHMTTGYSAMYRKADSLQLKSILPDSVSFSGDDVRFNLFTQYQLGIVQLQIEYLWASLNNKIANGYYILASLNRGKNQWVASWNKYNDLIKSTDNSPIVHLGYNYLVNQDKLKIMLDNEFQINDGDIKNYSFSIQLQLFFI